MDGREVDVERGLVFKHYWWLALVVGASAVSIAYAFGGESRMGLIWAALAGTLGFCYFVQQQKLAETELFHKLFTAFNARYDCLNGKLADMAEHGGAATSEQRKVIADYFNLCAEEYLFYARGYIPREVWRAWCRGMAWYLRRHPFREVWDQEVKTESYYGLTLEIIHEGAA
jgi:hypothetical protein